MTNEERDIITQFIGRVGGAQGASGFAGSVPATTQQALPPVDPDADRLIRDMFQRYPEEPYRITQLAFVQEHALTEAQNRIQRLEWELQQAKQAAQQQPQQQQQQSAGGGGFFSGLFGGGRSQQSAPPPQGGPSPAWNQGGGPAPGYPPNYQPQYAPPPPQYPPSYNPGMFQRGGSGFLGSALTTAAGVAGGMVAGNALMNLFSGNHGMGGGFGGYPGGGMVGSPWSTPAAAAPQYIDQGAWDQPQAGVDNASGGMPASNQDYVDNGTWDQPIDNAADNSGWDSSGSSDAGWDSGGGGGGSDDDSLI
jgi:hypothetical protein